ncbi:MAG TPA: S41 family peptidase [Anaerolineaceae bacterium]
MTIKRALVLTALLAALTACSLFAPRKSAVTPAAVPTSLQSANLLAPPTVTPNASAANCANPAPTASAPAGACGDIQQPLEVNGTFSYTNDIITTYYVEDAVSLTDMYGFVRRDKEWEIPVSSQNLGFLKIDREKKTGTFHIILPEQPQGKLVNVNPSSTAEKGVQIFAAAYSPNLIGSPYAEGDDSEKGWPSYLASVKTDSENKDEVTGGKVMIWAPDDQQHFPSDFGPDGLLFTQDDPVMAVPKGYSEIDLDQKPFKILRDAQVEMTLYEPKDAAIKDFSKLSYSEAFDQMFALARKEYAFNGIQDKAPDWDQVYAAISPKVKDAEQKKDPQAFYKALYDFTMAFKDGHTGLSGGDIGQSIYTEEFGGGYGFAIRELDDGKVMVIDVVKSSAAEKGGMKTGAFITQFNGKPIKDAIQAVQPPTGPHSMASTLRYDQARYLVRAPLGTKAKVTYTDGGLPKTIELDAYDERESLQVTSPFQNSDPNALPVYYEVVPSRSIGYISITSNYDDLNLIMRLFKRALDKFKENNLDTLIIDMRENSGGAPLGLAGFLTDQKITMGQLQYYSNKTGTFENEGDPQTIDPNQEQYHFNKMYLLVGQACASACELESYGFSKVPGMVVVGETPTSGTEAEVSRGQFKLPEGITMQIPTGRFILPDGSLFLEGQGVQPSKVVPINKDTALARDPVITYTLQLAGQ